MDGVHILRKNKFADLQEDVLILVVMDGVHIPVNIALPTFIHSLNPCCNGWCTHTTRKAN